VSVFSTVNSKKLQWFKHVSRMENKRHSRKGDLLRNVIFTGGEVNGRITLRLMSSNGEDHTDLESCPLANSGISVDEATCSAATYSFS
jgi:hypothetical protein